jgi:nucleoside phosphorylase
VAGALKSDIEIGDVVVAERVYAYHSGKEQDGELLARPRSYEAPHGLLQFARDVARELSDGVPGPDGAPRRFGVHVKPIAAGEVVLDSAGGGTRDHLHRVYNDAAAIEMEGAGAAVAAHVGAVPALMVRGISDRADGAKGVADSGGSQPEAAENAAAFAMAFLRDWSTHGLHDSNDEPSAQQNIQNVAVQGDGVFNIVQGGDQYTYYLDASES